MTSSSSGGSRDDEESRDAFEQVRRTVDLLARHLPASCDVISESTQPHSVCDSKISTFTSTHCYIIVIMGIISDDACLTSACLSVAYIGPKSRTERLKLAQR